MTRPLRIAVIGLGHHGRETVRLAAEAGAEVVAAIDPASAGRRLGDVVPGVDAPTIVAAGLEGGLAGADVAVVTARVALDGLADIVEGCFGHGADVLTIAEYAFDPFAVEPAVARRLDDAAWRSGRTLVVTGVQDVCWSGFVLQAAGAVRDLRAVRVRQHHGVDGYPAEFLDELGIGASDEGFDRAVRDLRESPAVLGAVLPVLARALSLTPGDVRREFSPIRATEVVASETLGRDLLPGEILGVREVTTMTSAEGVEFVADHSTTARRPGEQDTFDALLDAHPRFAFSHDVVPGPDAVDATVINRLLDVFEASPGSVPVTALGPARYVARLDVDEERG